MNRLAQLSKLRVIARTSAAQFKGETIDIERCRKELGVKAMVTGKVLRRGEQLSISANLIDIRNNFHLWGEKYNRTFSDIFIIEDEITRQIAEKLIPHLEPEEKRILSRQSAPTPKAYELCLRSRSFRNQFTQKSLRRAIEYLEMALEEDPNYALAYGELASCYWGLGNLGHSPPREAYPKVQASAIKALQLDIDLAEAHLALGQVNTDYNWDWRAAEPEYKRAIQLRPSDSWLRMCYSWYLSIVQCNEESISEMRRALDLDPLSIMVSTCVGEVLMLSRKSDQAIDQCQNVIAIDPTYWVTHYMLGLAHQQKGLFKDAIEALEKATLLAERDPVPLSMLGHAFGTVGRKEEARTILEELLVLRKQSYLSPFWISIVLLGLNEIDEALNWLEAGFAERAAYMNMILRYFHFDILHQDPRFKDLCRRINLIQCPA
jgi:tetratricopeptide (TPR) repeat protein